MLGKSVQMFHLEMDMSCMQQAHSTMILYSPFKYSDLILMKCNGILFDRFNIRFQRRIIIFWPC